DWYLRQLQRRAPPTFDAGAAPALYRGRSWPRPTRPWMSRFYLGDVADTLPEYVPLPQPATARLGSIQVALDPGVLRRPYLLRSDLAVLQIIKDQLGTRPVYFSTSTGNYPDQLGLSLYLVGEGLVRRVVARPVAPRDRKSTRLNSSHVAISYAVFCLKKKKKKHMQFKSLTT